MPEKNSLPNYLIDCHDIVHVVEFSPFEWSSQLIAIGTNSRVSVGSCKFQDEAADIDGMEYTPVRDFHHGTRVTAIAWAPDTSLLTIPKVLRFATGGADHKLRIFESDLKAEHHVKEVEGHTDYINAVAYDTQKGEHIVSVSDDQTCRMWSADGTEKACLPLGAPGMSVHWHKHDPLKVMVAEKGGIIRFYNVLTQQPILSLDTGVPPLLDADWSPVNALHVTALSATDWVTFDTSRSSRPIERHTAHINCGSRIRCSHSHEHLLVTIATAGARVQVFSTKTNQSLMSHELQIATCASWHYRLPLLAVGGDNAVHIWSIDTLG